METVLAPRSRRAAASGRRRAGAMTPTLVAVADALLINAGFFLAWYARYRLELGAEVAAENYVEWATYSSIELALTAVLLVVFRLQGLYRQRRGVSLVDEVGLVVNGTLVGIA